MIHPDEALKMLTSFDRRCATEEVPLLEALGRVLAEPVHSPIDSPPFAKAAMDGYAVNSADRSQRWRIIETIDAGHTPAKAVGTGQCSKIMTGAMIPPGADKVVRLEFVEEREAEVRLIEPEPNRNVIEQAEDLRSGQLVIDRKIVLPQDIGTLAAAGIKQVRVAIAPTVGIITTGSELREPGEPLGHGEIYNSNGVQLCAQVAWLHCGQVNYGTVMDDPRVLKEAIERAIHETEVVLLSGGVSVGESDFVPTTLVACGAKIHFHGLAIKPGRPTLFAQRDETFVFGLPGNPVSTFVIFELFVKPLLLRLMGITHVPESKKAKLSQEVRRKRSSRVEYRPVEIVGGEAHPLAYYGSSHLNVLGRADGLIRLEKGVATLEAGSEVDVRQIRS